MAKITPKKRRFFLFLTVLISLSIFSLYQKGFFEAKDKGKEEILKEYDLPEFKIEHKTFKLDNGLTVIVHEDRKLPQVSVNVIYKAGAKNERRGKIGLTKLLKNLMFKGTKNYNANYNELFEYIGATSVGAKSDSDTMHYYETVPSGALDLTLWLEADRMAQLMPAVDQIKLNNAVSNVINKRDAAKNTPYSNVNLLVAKNSFPKWHPYSWSDDESIEDLKNITIEDIDQWYTRYYTPNNAILVISGDISYDDVKQKVRKYFGSIPPVEQPKHIEYSLYKINSDKKQTIYNNVGQKLLVKVWNVNTNSQDEFVNLNLAASMLGSGPTSYLYKKLVDEMKLATDINVFIYRRKLIRQFYIEVYLTKDADVEQVERVINDEVNKLIDYVDDRKLNNIKSLYIVDSIRENETISDKAKTLALGEFFYHDTSAYEKQLGMIYNTTPAKIKAALINCFFDNGSFSLTIAPYEKYFATYDNFDRKKLPTVTRSAVNLKFPKIEKFQLNNGLDVVLLQRKGGPLVEMTLQFNAGYFADSFYKSGVAKLALSMLFDGTKNFSAYQLENMLDLLGSRLFTLSDIRTSNINISTLNNRMNDTLDIVNDMLENPLYNQNGLDTNRSILLEKINRENANRRSMIMRLLPSLLYKKNSPYALPWTGSGTENSLKSIQLNDIVDFYHNYLIPSNATLIAIGNISKEKLRESLEKTIGQWRSTTKRIMEIDTEHEFTNYNRGKIFIVDQPGSLQTTIVASKLIPPDSDKRNVELMVTNDIIVGKPLSRLNKFLRHEKHWTHGVYSDTFNANEDRIYVVATSVQTDKTAQTMSKFFSAYLLNNPLTEKELNHSKVEYIHKLMNSLQNNSSLLAEISALVPIDRTDNHLNSIEHSVQNITVNSATKAVKDFLNPNDFVWLIVGDRNKIENQINSLGWGKVEIIQPIQ